MSRCQDRLAVKHSSLQHIAEGAAAIAAAAGPKHHRQQTEEEELKRSSPTLPGLLLLLQVDEQESGTLGAEGQQDTLHHGRGHSKSQQQGPQLG